jgi:Ca2+-binding EF-hand superfamily protein
MMLLPVMLLAAMQAAQPTAASPQPAGLVRPQGPGRAFLSPMGEPFFGRTANEDGLVVWFEQADRNHDGVLTSDEMAADADRFFQLLDLKHDGEIDPDDITHYEQVVAPEIRIRPIFSATALPGGETDTHVDDESSAGQFGLLRNPEPVTSADSNWNRGVSPEEFRQAATRRFRLLDMNHTGKLTLAQLQEIRRSASTIAKGKRDAQPGASDDPHSAEYGGGVPPL